MQRRPTFGLYAFDWGELTGIWRYLSYKLDGKGVKDIGFSGPMIGATFRF